MHNTFEHMPQTLQPKVAVYATATAKKAENICRRNGIGRDTLDAIITDAFDVLAGSFRGFHATFEQMREVAKKTKRISWERTELAELAMVTEYYTQIVDAVENGTAVGGSFVDAAVVCGLKQLNGQEPTPTERHGAERLYFTLCLLIIGADCNATEEELAAIPAMPKEFPEVLKQKCIKDALNFQRQRQAIEATAERRRQRRKKQTEPEPPQEHTDAELVYLSVKQHGSFDVVSNPNRVIPHYQNITQVLGGELQTAPVTREGGAAALRPLRTAIAERVAIAEQLKEQAKTDSSITAADIQRAENLITNRESIYHAIDGLHIMTQEVRPTSRTDMTTGYTITPYRFAQLATGQEKPHQTQVLNIMRALDFLSMERMEVVEEVVKYYPVKDKDGNVERGADGRIQKKPKKLLYYTRFTPANTRFYGEFGEEVPLLDAFTMNIQVDKMITEGRSEHYKEVTLDSGKKQKLLVQVPRVNYLQTHQIYELNNECGTRFRNILISKSHMAQDTLLADVFDYNGRLRDAQAKAKEAQDRCTRLNANGVEVLQREADAAQAQYDALKDNPNAKEKDVQATRKRAEEAQAVLDAVRCNPQALEDVKKQAHERWEDAARNATAKRIASKHSDRDIQILREMFEQAQEHGIIRSYYARPAANAKRKANGEWTAAVWEWLRPTAEDMKN